MAAAPIVFFTADLDALARVQALLEDRGLEVCHGGTGAGPVRLLDPAPCLVLIDTALEGADAATLLPRLVGREAPARPPVLVLARRDDAEAALAAVRAGADDVVFRPFDAWGFPARVEGLLSRRQLAEARDQCRALEFRNHELESFIYIVTHDMKTPVVNLQGLVGLVEQDHAAGLPAEVRDYLARLRRNAERLEELLRDLLEYPRRLSILDTVEECEIGDVAAEAIDGLRELVRARGVEVEVAADLPRVEGDARRLQQVFHNLVENAIKHAGGEHSPRVEVGWTRTPRGPLFHVRDNGAGIPEDQLESVFKLFHRVAGTGSDGTGIGLAVAKQLVEAHGGEIWCESRPGEGATFLFRLA
jgi:signal transduction histidine kinase